MPNDTSAMPAGGGEISRARRCIAALTALKETGEGTPAPEQRAALAGWGGWGPLAKAFNYDHTQTWQDIATQVGGLLTGEEYSTARDACDTAFYTPPLVTQAMWDMVQALGFTGGKALEPGCGGGNFIAAAPAGLPIDWTGVEADQISARIAQLQHPHAKIIGRRLEKTALRYGGYDLAIGNVPFSKVEPYDPNAPGGLSTHNYFIWRALSAVRPGGLVALVTSRWTLDAEEGDQRKALAQLGSFIGALRLPGGALKQGGTEAVTDIVVFRRSIDGDPGLSLAWLEDVRFPVGLHTGVSAWFVRNPDMILGELADRGGDRYGMTLDVIPPAGQDLPDLVAGGCARLAAGAAEAGLAMTRRGGDTIDLDDAEGAANLAWDGKFTLHASSGLVTQQRDGRQQPARAGEELVMLVRLAVAADKLFAAEADQGMGANARERIRQDAMRQYQAYKARYGYLNRSDLSSKPDPDGEPGDLIWTRRRPRLGGFRADPRFVTTLALEVWDDDAQTGVPAPILFRHLNVQAERKTSTDDPAEALALALDAVARPDLEVIAGLLGCDVAAVPGKLDGLIWEDPGTGEYVTAEDYLSGNVRAKLAAARAAARAAAETDPGRWAKHVAALEAVQPDDLGPDDISAQLGSPWIPTDVIHQFICGLLGAPPRRVEVRFVPLTSAWEVKADPAARKVPAATAEWGTLRVNAFDLIEDSLNGTMPVVYDYVDDTKIRNQQETALAADKIRDLQERFGEWLWDDPDRAAQLARIYNDRFNSIRVRSYDGSLLSFPGLTLPPGWSLYQSQRDMVWQSVCEPATLCGHTVGAGKTSIMVATAMTLRRLGLARKPAMIVPNHLLEQETAEARRLYPGAKILMVTREDLTKERRRAFAAKVGAQDWDLILMTHQQFLALPVSAGLQADYLADLIGQFDEAMQEESLENSRAAKQLAGRRKRLVARHEMLLDSERDIGVTFEQTGIDYVMVDEAHLYKNLEMVARSEGFNTSGSKRADDLLMKLNYLRDRNPDGRCGSLFTGTPISNSLAELHVLFRYLAPGMLALQGITAFDSFAAQYIRYATKTEVAPDGSGFRQNRRPDRYTNLPELRSILGRFASIRTRADLQLAGPQVRVMNAPSEPQPQLSEFTATLVERADKIRSGGVKPDEDNMLAICGDGRRAALDLRLVGIEPEGPGKLEDAARRIAAIYHMTKTNLYPDPSGQTVTDPRRGALQLVFCDQGTPKAKTGDTQVYGRLRAMLIGEGVPAGKIAFVHQAKTHGDRAALFARCRTGEISVLIASTEKAGTGVNIQARLAAIHHLDAPWRPADVEQRDGRGDRPGNGNPALLVYRYVTEGSFDAYMWQALERKQRFIGQILNGDPAVREVEDAGNPALLSYGELKAIATGQPLLMELSEVNSKIARLRNAKSGHGRTQKQMRKDWQEANKTAGLYGRTAEELDLVARCSAGVDDRVLMTPAGQRFPAGEETLVDGIAYALRQARDRDGRALDAGQYRGAWVAFETMRQLNGAPKVLVSVSSSQFARDPYSYTSQQHVWQAGGAENVLAELDEQISRAAELAEVHRGWMRDKEQRADECAAYLRTPFPHQDELNELVAERKRIELEIDAQVKKPEDAGSETGRQPVAA